MCLRRSARLEKCHFQRIETAKNIPGHHKNPKFQFSKIPIFQKKQKKQKNQLCQDFASPPLPPMVCAELVFLFFFCFFFEIWNFGKLEFWKLPWGEGGVEAE